jgi:PKD repeat protein
LGNYTLSATPYSGAGLGGTAGQSLSLQFSIVAGGGVNQPPVAVASATPLNGNAPLAVSFTGSNSTDNVGIAGFSWNFGDGSPTSSQANPSHTYTTAGTHNAVLTVVDGGGLQDSETITITVISSPQSSIVSLTLIDADQDVDLFTIVNGQQINNALIQGKKLNIRANTNPSTVGSVSFLFTGPVNKTSTENVAPYALFGDADGNYAGSQFPLGTYTISATPYSGANKGGTAGLKYSLQFSIVGLNTAKSAVFRTTTDNSVINEDLRSVMVLYPNPAASDVQITLPDRSVYIKEVSLHDLSGRMVRRYEAAQAESREGEFRFNVSDIEDGVYLVHLRTDSVIILKYKLVVKK